MVDRLSSREAVSWLNGRRDANALVQEGFCVAPVKRAEDMNPVLTVPPELSSTY